jgi:hypothetical protein
VNADQIIAKVKALDLSPGEFIVFGSCPLAGAGLRLASDIDLLVSDKVLDELKIKGWQQVPNAESITAYTLDVFEAYTVWAGSSYRPTLAHLLDTADYLQGIPFASLLEVRQWKQALGRPKDIEDIALIDGYLSRS